MIHPVNEKWTPVCNIDKQLRKNTKKEKSNKNEKIYERMEQIS